MKTIICNQLTLSSLLLIVKVCFSQSGISTYTLEALKQSKLSFSRIPYYQMTEQVHSPDCEDPRNHPQDSKKYFFNLMAYPTWIRQNLTL